MMAEEEEEDGSLSQELEVLQSIYLEELEVCQEDRLTLRITIHPTTGDDPETQYVRMTLQIAIPPQYPGEAPEISVTNPRGLGDEQIERIIGDLRTIVSQSVGRPILYELIEKGKELLTASNLPRGHCVICLYGFQEDDGLTKTLCFHHFHSYCLGRYVQHCLESVGEGPVECPVCREGLDCDYKKLQAAAPPQQPEELYVPDSLTLRRDKELRQVYERQRAAGGIIDLEAERNRFFISIQETPAGDQEAQETRPASAEPTRPGAELTRPGAEPTRPGAEPTRPGAEPTRPGAEQTRPGAEQTRPGAEQTRRGAEPTHPASAELTRPGAEQTRRASAKPTRPGAEPTRPGAEPTRPGAEQTRPGAEQTRPGAEQTRPASAEQTRRGAEPTHPASAELTRPGAEQTRRASAKPTRPGAKRTPPASAERTPPASAERTPPASAERTPPASAERTPPASAERTRPGAEHRPGPDLPPFISRPQVDGRTHLCGNRPLSSHHPNGQPWRGSRGWAARGRRRPGAHRVWREDDHTTARGRTMIPASEDLELRADRLHGADQTESGAEPRPGPDLPPLVSKSQVDGRTHLCGNRPLSSDHPNGQPWRGSRGWAARGRRRPSAHRVWREDDHTTARGRAMVRNSDGTVPAPPGGNA